MAIQTVAIGTVANDGLGDNPRTGITKVNSNFTDPANAASKLVGTGADQLPTNAEIRNPRNRIVNPSMAISQENGDGPNVIGGSDLYMADQWLSGNFGAGGTITGSRSSSGVKVLATVATTNLTGTNVFLGFRCRIESQDIIGFNGGDVSLSFSANVNWSGNLAVSIQTYDLSRSYVVDVQVSSGDNTFHVVIPFEAATVLVDDNTTGLILTLCGNSEGTRQTSTIGAWAAGYFIATTASTQWTKTINNYVEITNVDLYAGNVPREFQPDSYSQDLFECQRYSIDLLGGSYIAGSPVIVGACLNNSDVYAVFEHRQMRAIPTLINSASGHFSIFEDNSSISCDLVSVGASGLSRNEVRFRSTGTQTSGNSALIRTNSADARLFLNARL
tara:strand:- start:5206 stop:6369 length:1164 start_codon:yes stop_codon:yes gene_type:complete